MKKKNQLIKFVREIIGEEEATGFFTYVDYNHKEIKVPNFLFKDAPAEYPEIRISPFIKDVEETNQRRIVKMNRLGKLRHYTATFQVDIYATNIVMLNNIYDAVYNRIDLFNDYDMVRYGYNASFKKIGKYKYFTSLYNSRNFNIVRILIDNMIIRQVKDMDSLENNAYIINEDGLYVQTTLPIHKIRIYHIINGLRFSNNRIAYDEHIINMKITNKKMLSELEDNNVERITFDLNIFYNMLQERYPGSILDDINVTSDKYGRKKRSG